MWSYVRKTLESLLYILETELPTFLIEIYGFMHSYLTPTICNQLYSFK